MTDTGAISPGTMTDDDAVGNTTWSNVDNAKVSDDSRSTWTGGAGSTTHYLKATNFGFSIPGGATINGIKVEIERGKVSGTKEASDLEVKIVKSDGSIGDEDKWKELNWAGEAYFTYGGATDLWSESWEASDINDEDFGVVVQAYCTGGGGAGTWGVDHIRITVYYTVEEPSTTILPLLREKV